MSRSKPEGEGVVVAVVSVVVEVVVVGKMALRAESRTEPLICLSANPNPTHSTNPLHFCASVPNQEKSRECLRTERRGDGK